MLTYFTAERHEGEPIRSPIYRDLYCNTEAIDPKILTEILESVDRSEFYCYDAEDFTPIGVLFLTSVLTIHHGVVCAVAAHWVHPHVRCREYQKDMYKIIESYCRANGLSKYQRDKHLSDSHQLTITKEI